MTPDKEPLPDFSDVKGGSSSSAPMSEGAPQDEVMHSVEPGDSLSRIAKKYYGDASKWKMIYEANRDLIKNPDLIHPGQVFRIPEL